MARFKVKLATKISLLLLGVVSFSLLVSGGYSYFSLLSEVEENLGKRLEYVASTAAMLIPGKLHQKTKTPTPANLPKIGSFHK